MIVTFTVNYHCKQRFRVDLSLSYVRPWTVMTHHNHWSIVTKSLSKSTELSGQKTHFERQQGGRNPPKQSKTCGDTMSVRTSSSSSWDQELLSPPCFLFSPSSARVLQVISNRVWWHNKFPHEFYCRKSEVCGWATLINYVFVHLCP